MQLRAEHVDGFTEHLVRWVLEATDGSATIEASWHTAEGRVERIFEIDFPDSQIETCATTLAKLKPKYDGCVDDFPKFLLSVTGGDHELCTRVNTGINWSEEDKAGVDAFMMVWRPIYSEVERLLAIPNRG